MPPPPPQMQASASAARRLSPFEDDESGDEGYDTFRSSSAGSSSMQIPPPPSVPRPPRIRMLGTVLPQDSMRGNRTRAGRKPFGANHVVNNAKLFAAAGLDLFRQGLAFDGLQPLRHAPRHPAVTPNLNPIPEDEDAYHADGVSVESQVILVLGAGPLRRHGEVNACVANRIEAATQLYWEITKAFAEQQANSHCYLVPMAEESCKDGVLECEAIRNALAAAGISPHHIVMDCSAPSVIDNTVLLTPVLRHLHIELVHVVTSQFQLPRVKACVDGILSAACDMAFKTVYHAAPDGFRATERAKHEKLESAMLRRTHQALADAIDRQKQQQQQRGSASISTKSTRSRSGVDSTRGATRTASRDSSGAFSSGLSRAYRGV